MITYTGRRSGRTFSIPVGYSRDGDDLVIAVELSDLKTWWRNFEGDGVPVTVRLDGTDRAGHAVARRDQAGEVTVAGAPRRHRPAGRALSHPHRTTSAGAGRRAIGLVASEIFSRHREGRGLRAR